MSHLAPFLSVCNTICESADTPVGVAIAAPARCSLRWNVDELFQRNLKVLVHAEIRTGTLETVDGGDGVNELICAFQAQRPDVEILKLLSQHVHDLVGDDLVHRLVPFAPRLATFDYSDYPWAGLSGGVAICAIDRPLGRTILTRARLQLAAEGQVTGEGYGCFLEGLEDLGQGNLDGAGIWWARAMPLLDDSGPSLMISAHLALATYARGDVDTAILLGQQTLWAAEHANNTRAVVIACTGLGLFYLASGQLRSVENHVRRGLLATEQLAPENRYELPVLILAQAVLDIVRGHREASEANFTAAINEAIAQGNRWYEAICLAVRAEFTAPCAPDRATADARTALDYLDSIKETWWSRSARIAYATAHFQTGNLAAGKAACATLLTLDLNPLDRGRTLLVAAELAAASGDNDSVALAEQARVLLSGTGAHYWAGRANMVLSRLDRRRREFHRRRALQCAGAQSDDPGWRNVLRGPGVLSLHLLGVTRLTLDARPIRFETRAEFECLAMLALAPRGLATTVIGDRLWPDEDPAKVAHRVDNLISGLRRRLEPTSRLHRDRTRISLELLPGECDARDLVGDAEKQLNSERFDQTRSRAIRQLLESPLLDDIDIPWVGVEWHRLRQLAARLEMHNRHNPGLS